MTIRGITTAPALLAWPTQAVNKRTGSQLTPREREVVRALGQGLTAVAVGRRLGISPHTVKRHIESVYAKLGTHDRATTMLIAQRIGLLGD